MQPTLVRFGCDAVAALARPALIAVGLFVAGSNAISLATDADSGPASTAYSASHSDANPLEIPTAERPVLSIELHPTWWILSGSVSSDQVATELSFAVGDAFPRRCFSCDLDIAESPSESMRAASATIDLPLNLDQLPDLLREFAASTRPIRIDWFSESRRLVVRGHVYSRVTMAALAMRLRMASLAGAADEINFENRIEVIAPPRSRLKSSLALASMIERDFENVELPLLPPVEFQPIYFTQRNSAVDPQEMPKLIDALDQISTANPNGDWPKLIITGYALPRGDQIEEIADGLRRANSVRDQLVALGVPEDHFTVHSVAANESAGLTWRSRRVEIRIDLNHGKKDKLVTSLSPLDR